MRWALITMVILSGIALGGCATAKATSEPETATMSLEPSVTLEIVSFDPEMLWEHTITGTFGEVDVVMQGKVVLHAVIEPDWVNVYYEQSPDLKNWVPLRNPVTKRLIAPYTYEVTFEAIPTLEEKIARRQFFRARYE